VGGLLSPGLYFRGEARRLYEDDIDLARAHADGVARWTTEPLSEGDFSTGVRRFDGEWLFGTYVMSAIGHANVARAHPEYRDEAVRRMEVALTAVKRREVRAFDRDAWGSDPLTDIGTSRAHVAYLGYYDLALALLVELDPETPLAELEARITAHLSRLMRRSETGLLLTYPGETYPVDNAAFIAALGVHDRATGDDHSDLIERFAELVRTRYRDPETGLLYQAVHPRTGEVVDGGRGSGTAFASFFLSYVDPTLSADLYEAMQTSLLRRGLGFAAMREHAFGGNFDGDVDSGPVILGLGPSATGFALGAARANADEETFGELYTTAALVGAPIEHEGARTFALGGPIGDAILFAMLTTPKGGVR
jgi:hypothetical protein